MSAGSDLAAATADLPPLAGHGLFVFDMDGTLYDQPPLRRAMAARLLWHSLRHADLRLPRLLADLRRRREQLAENEVADFEVMLFADIAARHRIDAATVHAIAHDWLEIRPLPHLAAHATPGVHALFAALRRAGCVIAVLSDYPASAKLAALGLAADIVVAATDSDIGLQKPHPKGLEAVMARAGFAPADTLMIGDRADRDGAAAARAGTAAVIRTRSGRPGSFRDFTDACFAPFLAGGRLPLRAA